jgi:glyoxylase-like metal-dependent hydrolase (beta-lactamase superfamily II)
MDKIEAERETTERRPMQHLRRSHSRRLILFAAASLTLGLVNIPLARSDAINADDVIKRAHAAMGGADVKSVQIRGVGPGSLFGQAYEPGFEWPKVIYTSLSRVLDFEHEAYREDAARSRAELLGGGATPPFGLGDLLTIGFLKDGVSWNTVGPFVGPATALLEARVNDLWTTSPHGAILAAKKFGATAETKQLDGQSFSTLSFTIPRKMSAVVWVNSAGFVTKIDSMVPNAMLGDMDVVTRFEDYRDVGGLKFPMRLRQSAAGTEVFDISVQDVKIDVPAKIDVPEAIRGAKPRFTVQKVVNGVWFLEGPTHNSVAIEMKDQIVLVESPMFDGYAEQIFLAANALVPGKKVGTVIATHHHFDHAGGLRYAASQGATLVTSSMALPYYERIFSNPGLIAPDRLATSGRKAAFVGVDDLKVLSDDNQRIEIHQIRDSMHSRGFLMVYLPKNNILIEGDPFHIRPPTSPALPLPVGSELNLVDNLDRLELKVDTILPLHFHALTERELRARTQKPTRN